MQKGEKMISKKILVLLALAPITAGVVTVAAVNSASALNKVDAATMPSNTRRIWIINNDNWWTDNDYYAYAWNAKGNATSSAVNIVLSDAYHGFGYVDIELEDATSAINVIIRDGGTTWGNNNQTVTVALPAFGGADTIWLSSGVTWNGTDNRNDRNASAGTTNGFSAIQLHWILVNGHFDTCSAANTNGYNAYPQMKTNIFDKTDVDLTGEIVSGTYSVQDYIDGMSARYTKNN